MSLQGTGVKPRPQRPLGQFGSWPGEAGDASGHLVAGDQQVSGGHLARHQPDPLGLRGADIAASEHDLKSPGGSDRPRQQVAQAQFTGGQAVVDAGRAKVSVGCGHPDISGQRQAQAGRPLSVEDASTGQAGSGHLDTWAARDPGGARSATLSAAWSPTSRLELSAAVARDRRIDGLFAVEPDRLSALTLTAAGLELDGRALSGSVDHKRFLVKAAMARDRIEGSLQDITEKSRAAADLYFLANHDSLTKVLNRRGIEKALNHAIATLTEDKVLALAYLDLDRFKLINDLYGHGAGDEVLQQVCKRISDMLSRDIQLGRVGGDEFVIVFPATPISMATVLCRGLVDSIGNQAFRVGDNAPMALVELVDRPDTGAEVVVAD